MSFYRLQRTDDGQPYTHGMAGVYRGVADIVETVSDDEAERRGLVDAAGFPVPGWIWWPGEGFSNGDRMDETGNVPSEDCETPASDYWQVQP